MSDLRRLRSDRVVEVIVELVGGTMAEVADKLLAEVIPQRYLLIDLLGQTRHSIVFAAVDQLVARKVALKIHLARGWEAERKVLIEARAMARLDHPHVVRVFDLGEDGGRLYTTMQLCDGNLQTWAAGRTWGEVVDRMIEAGRGLQAVHAAGLVHGDVKPENILLEDGVARLGDFGLAAAPGWSARIPGTPGFIAPEVADGDRGVEGDVFALACSAWACLFGVAPFGEPPPGADASAATLVLVERARAGELVVGEERGVPGRLVAGLRAALAADPRRRPSLEDALAQWGACRVRRRWAWGWRRAVG